MQKNIGIMRLQRSIFLSLHCYAVGMAWLLN